MRSGQAISGISLLPGVPPAAYFRRAHGLASRLADSRPPVRTDAKTYVPNSPSSSGALVRRHAWRGTAVRVTSTGRMWALRAAGCRRECAPRRRADPRRRRTSGGPPVQPTCSTRPQPHGTSAK